MTKDLDCASGPVFVNDPVQFVVRTLGQAEYASELEMYPKRDVTMTELVDEQMFENRLFACSSYTSLDSEIYVGDVADIVGEQHCVMIHKFFMKVKDLQRRQLSYYTLIPIFVSIVIHYWHW